ncbi:MAG: flagellar hook-associated protein FlgK [Candidatus Coatesbacteria bacterium]
MASTFGSIATMMTSLRVQSLAQQILANNIANATTRGYSRQVPILAALAPLSIPSLNSSFGPGQIGSGVRLASIERVRDEFLDLRIRSESAVMGEQQAIQQALADMQVLFPELNAIPGQGLMTAVQTFFDDWKGLAAGTVSRGTLLQDAVAMTTLFHQADASLRDLDNTQDLRVRSTITQINGLLGRIASANQGIMAAQAAGGSANALLDSRDQALTDLSKLIKIDTVRLGDGSVLVMTGNARALVRGAQAGVLTPLSMVHEPAYAAIGWREPGGGSALDITGEIPGGALKGLMTARDQVVADERLELDELASSLIAQVNILHMGGYATDGTTTGLPFFAIGTGLAPLDAGDIAVNPAIAADANLLAASRINGDGTNTEQAATLGALRDLVMNAMVQSRGAINTGVGMVDPTRAMNDMGHSPLNGASPPFPPMTANGVAGGFRVFQTIPTASGTLVINGVRILWTTADSIDQIVAKINTAMGGTVRASFEYSFRERLTLIGSGPLTVYDELGNLTQALRLEGRQVSLTAVNNGFGPLDRTIPSLTVVGQAALEWRTVAANKGQVTFQWQAPAGSPNAVTYAWDATQDLTGPAGILAGINTALTGAGATFQVLWNPATQSFTIQGLNALPATSANPLSPVTVTDTEGNLSMLFNLEAQPTFGVFTDTLLAQMQAARANADAMLDQAKAAVGQLQLQQDAIAKVDVNEEQAQLMEYTRAYEASVRAMAALDECLNVLINRMAASTFAGSSTASVLTS